MNKESLVKQRSILSEEIDEKLEGASVFEPRDVYDNAIIGMAFNENSEPVAVYGYSALIESLMLHDEMSEEDAIEWIEYNTLRTIPYMGERRPIVVHELENTSYIINRTYTTGGSSDEDDVL